MDIPREDMFQLPDTLVYSPTKVFRGFDMVFLKPKQVKTVTFKITKHDLSMGANFAAMDY